MLLILQGEAVINSSATPNNQANSVHLAHLLYCVRLSGRFCFPNGVETRKLHFQSIFLSSWKYSWTPFPVQLGGVMS